MKRPPGTPKWKWNMRHQIAREQEDAQIKDRLPMMIQAGVEWVEWITAGDGSECEHCKSMAGKVVRITEVKFTEHPECEHEAGCRCLWIPVGKPDNLQKGERE